MKRLGSVLGLLALIATGFTVLTPVAAEATRGCVTRWEYRHVYAGDSPTRVRRLFDTGGFERGRFVQFVYDGYSDYDEFGNRVGHEDAYWDEFDNYVEEQGGYAREVDHVRSYKKCRSFDRGRGRVGILFDNYTYGVNGAYGAHRYHPSYLLWWKDLDWGRGQGKAGLSKLAAR